MSRGAHIDKYEPIGGGFRAPLSVVAGPLTADDNGTVQAVSLNANGQVVIGTAGQSGFVGLMVLTKREAVGTVVDIMTDGEVVDVPGLAAGTKYYANADGSLGTTTANPYIGVTVEADRLVVRTAR